ncbi:MAG TPA: alpha/beta fold hydrolase [Candidatus Acidoferrales bacterium]
MKPFTARKFVPQRMLKQRDAMTIAAAFWPRRHKFLSPGVERLFEVEPGTKILAAAHWQPQPKNSPTLVLVHGLEGDIKSEYMLGTADKAFSQGFNVIRVNQRNCGGSDALSNTLYNSGLSNDYLAILIELIDRDELPAIFFGGYSMGGNLVLKMAGELGPAAPPQLRGICAVVPALDLTLCVDACGLPRNKLYNWHFVTSLRRRIRRKEKLFPGIFKFEGLEKVRTLRDFDDVITAPNCGYQNADDYYFRASAVRSIYRISVPTLLIAAKDDPVIPFESYSEPGIATNPNITLLAEDYGGHGSFISNNSAERHWAEARIVEFCQNVLSSGETIPQVSQATG